MADLSYRNFKLSNGYTISVWNRHRRNHKDYKTIWYWLGASKHPLHVRGETRRESMGKLRLALAAAENPAIYQVNRRLLSKL